MNNTRQIQTFIVAVTVAAVATAMYAGAASHSLHPYLNLSVLALAAITSRMKVKLPGVNGNMSVNLPFLLTAVVKLSALEAIVVTCVSTAVQCWPRKGAKFNPQQMTFNLSMMTLAASLSGLVFHAPVLAAAPWANSTLALVLATVTLFLGQTLPVAGILAVSESKATFSVWRTIAQLSFPYYVVSIGLTSMVQTVTSHLGWGLALAVFPVMYGIHHSFRMYFGRTAATRPDSLARAAGASV